MIEFIKSDGRTELYKDFLPLLEKTDSFHRRFLKEWEISPFAFTEQTVVGAFVWSAGSLGLYCLNEYQVLKSKKPNKKPKLNGRADFWIDFGERNYSLEFKRAKQVANFNNLRKKLNIAIEDISKVDTDEHLRACAILSAYAEDDKKNAIYEKFAEEDDIDLAVRIGKPKGEGVYLYFSKLEA
ncbi:hypothetical protein ACR9YC_06915 [Parasphingorhabdus sp. DH2-15]|uniref:hypothetical protein n=1 Tax=Parasphingorhabdus sp. DH2-15 TaxID=3444112 RepID=UPI003F68303D